MKQQLFTRISCRSLAKDIAIQGMGIVFVLYSSSLMAICNEPTTKLVEFPLEQLLDMNVNVASKVALEADKQPASVTVISREQLQLSAARTLNEALMTYVPGFFLVEDQDDMIAAFRGLAADNNSKVLMLLNGHNINAEWFLGPPDNILNSNNFDWIERIEVIRGPGSVTLGQGALLGVINIITRKEKNLAPTCGQYEANLMGGYGTDNAWQAGMESGINDKDYGAYIHVNESNYDGQSLRREGWTAEKAFLGFSGGVIADADHRLKRSDNLSISAHLRYQQWHLDILHIDQIRDGYNSFRDRDQFQQIITHVGLTNRWAINKQLELETKANAVIDDMAAYSIHSDIVTSGTQENRYGLQEVLRIKELWEGNVLAIGAEFHFYDSGRKNSNGDNFLLNVASPENIRNLEYFKRENTYVFPVETHVYSFFIEDHYQITNEFSVFGGLRYDEHKYWGNHVSPRIGAFYSPWAESQFRLSYQEGFRGAVGLNYGGCCKNDGFLREDNFDQISKANIPGYSNFNKIRPETLKNIELAFSQKFKQNWRFENVLFYNIVEDIIDVGVIYGDSLTPPTPLAKIGTDSPGTNNNYWFFKNNQGSIEQIGNESSLSYHSDSLSVTLSHAFVNVVSAADQNAGSMYLSKNKELRAYPDDQTRLNLIWKPLEQISLGVNYLYYCSWHSTSGIETDGGHLLNASLLYKPWKNLELSLNVKNILSEDNLYPMTNNVNGIGSPGAPALEQPSFWFKVRLNVL